MSGTTQCYRSHLSAWEQVDAITLVALSLGRNNKERDGGTAWFDENEGWVI